MRGRAAILVGIILLAIVLTAAFALLRVMGSRRSAAAPPVAMNRGHEQMVEPRPASGPVVFRMMGCAACHAEDTRLIGAPTRGLWMSERKMRDGQAVIADADYIRRSILDPASEITEGYANQMPSYNGKLTVEQVELLIEYYRSMAATPETDNDSGP